MEHEHQKQVLWDRREKPGTVLFAVSFSPKILKFMTSASSEQTPFHFRLHVFVSLIYGFFKLKSYFLVFFILQLALKKKKDCNMNTLYEGINNTSHSWFDQVF